jgi:hypothetical protein
MKTKEEWLEGLPSELKAHYLEFKELTNSQLADLYYGGDGWSAGYYMFELNKGKVFTQEVELEKLLNVKRAFFDMMIRGCGISHRTIMDKFDDPKSQPLSYLNLIKAVAQLIGDLRLPNPTGQLGLETTFYDKIRGHIKTKDDKK